MHSAFEIPLDQDANFNPRGVPSRACGHCYSQFKEWRCVANAQSPTRISPDGSRNFDSPTTPVAASPTVAGVGVSVPPEIAHSVPRDWNWSTF